PGGRPSRIGTFRSVEMTQGHDLDGGVDHLVTDAVPEGHDAAGGPSRVGMSTGEGPVNTERSPEVDTGTHHLVDAIVSLDLGVATQALRQWFDLAVWEDNQRLLDVG